MTDTERSTTCSSNEEECFSAGVWKNLDQQNEKILISKTITTMKPSLQTNSALTNKNIFYVLVFLFLKACSHSSGAELSVVKITIKLQPWPPSYSVATLRNAMIYFTERTLSGTENADALLRPVIRSRVNQPYIVLVAEMFQKSVTKETILRFSAWQLWVNCVVITTDCCCGNKPDSDLPIHL